MVGNNNKEVQDGKSVELSMLEVLNFVLMAGGPEADVIANADDKDIESLIMDIPKVRIITK